MGVSFKVAKAGNRYRPKLLQVEDKEIENDPLVASQQRENEGDPAGLGDKVTSYSTALAKSGLCLSSEDPEASFSLNLFPSGFSIGKPNKSFISIPKHLLPYDRASETLFHAIERGCLPGDVYDDLPCKYINGALLCEIQDYRNILSQKGDATSSMEKSPVIHKVVLQMCMENVVKDLSSISNDSWTYKDLLEFESQILKALRPDLHLDPKPMLYKYFEEPLAKKLDLGISWNSKKIKVTDGHTTNQNLRNPSPGIQVSKACASMNSNILSNVQRQDRVSYSPQLIPSSINISNRSNILEETMLEFSHPTSQSNDQTAVAYDQSLSGAISPSNDVPAPKSNFGHSYQRIPSSLTLRKQTRNGTLANRGPMSKIPKQEPQDFFQGYLPETQAERKPAHELWRKHKPLCQQTEAETILHERAPEKMHLSPSRKNDLQAIPEGKQKLQPEVFTARVKQEPMETCMFQSLKAAKVSHVSSSAIRALPSHIDSPLPRETSLPKKRKANSPPKGSSMKRVEFIAGTGGMNNDVAGCFTVGAPPPCSTVIDGPVRSDLETPDPSQISDNVRDRLSKMHMLIQRYSLDNTKRKYREDFRKRSFSCQSTLVAFQLLNSEDNNLKDFNTECCPENNRNIFKTRKLTFVRSSRAFQDYNSTSMAQNKLTILEKLQKGTVEATVAYGLETFDPIELSLSETFSNTHHAELFAAQFTSLMMREGYCLAADQIQPMLHVTAGSSPSQPNPLTSSTTAAAETLGPVHPYPTPERSPGIFNHISSSFSAPGHFPSQSNFSGGHLLPSVNLPYALPLSAGYLSKPTLESASQLSTMHPQWQHIVNKRTSLWVQMLQRERLQSQLLQKRIMMGGLGAATCSSSIMRLSGEAQWLGNSGGLGSFGNDVNTGGSMPLLMGGDFQGIGSSGGSSTPAAALASLRIAENEGRASMRGFSLDQNTGMALACPPNYPVLAPYQTINQQPLQTQRHQQLYMPQYLESRSPLQPAEATSLSEHVGSPLSHSSLIQMEQQSRMSTQQISSSTLVPRQMDSGNIYNGGPWKCRVGCRTPGSII